MARLEILLLRLKTANLKLKPSKCHIMQQEVLFLGHIVSPQSIATDPDKIRHVETWPVPRNIKELRSFVGLCSYYRKFVDSFATIAEPLHGLTKKGQKFIWDVRCQEALDELKRRLISSPILGLPKDDGRYILDTDASDYSLGAVLPQVPRRPGEGYSLCQSALLQRGKKLQCDSKGTAGSSLLFKDISTVSIGAVVRHQN